MPSDIVSTCYEGGAFGKLAIRLAFLAPVYMWVRLYGRLHCRDRFAYFFVYANSYLFTWVAGLVLQSDSFRKPPSDPSCNNASYSMPSLEAAFLSQYYLMALAHHAYFRIPPSRSGLAYSAFTLLSTVSLLLWSGNYVWSEMLVGAALGAAMAFAFTFVLYESVTCRIPFFLRAKRGFAPTEKPFEHSEWAIL